MVVFFMEDFQKGSCIATLVPAYKIHVLSYGNGLYKRAMESLDRNFVLTFTMHKLHYD